MTAQKVITVDRAVLAQAQGDADAFRQDRAARGAFVVNVLSSPGAGKTSLLAATADHWAGSYKMAVLVGDIATDRDAQRLAPHAPAVQLTTGGACHLEYSLVERGWYALGAPDVDFLFIENVGNLVCPASHDLGEHLRVVLLSVTEGDDKPAKYPKAFRSSHALVLSKIDLLPHVPFRVENAAADARSIRSDLAVLPISVQPPQGVDVWCSYLAAQRDRMLQGNACHPNR